MITSVPPMAHQERCAATTGHPFGGTVATGAAPSALARQVASHLAWAGLKVSGAQAICCEDPARPGVDVHLFVAAASQARRLVVDVDDSVHPLWQRRAAARSSMLASAGWTVVRLRTGAEHAQVGAVPGCVVVAGDLLDGAGCAGLVAVVGQVLRAQEERAAASPDGAEPASA